MQIQKRSKKTLGRIVIIAGIALLVILGYGLIAHNNNYWPFLVTTPKDVNLSPPTSEEQQGATQIKSSSVDPTVKTSPGSTTTTATPKTDPSANQSTTTVTITNYSTSRIGVLIEAVLSSGTCNLQLTNSSGTTYSYSSSIFAQSSSSTCKDFGMDSTKITPGTWTVTVDITSGSTTGHVSQQLQLDTQ
jgi:hypothetical protein